MSGVRRLVASAALTALAVVAWAAPAAAHAAVTSSRPVQGAHLDRAPHTVTIDFDQPVRPDNGGLVVLDAAGRQVQVSSSHPAPATLQAVLPASLRSGAYVSDYTVTSVDGHVVSGGIVFLVGRVSAGAASLAVSGGPHTTSASRVDDLGQFLTYGGVLVATGLAFFAAFVLGAGPERRRLRRWAVAATVLGVVGLLVSGAAQADLTGGGLGALAHADVDRQVFGGAFGRQCAAQLAGLVACLVSFRLRGVMARQFAAFYGLLLAAGAFVLFGHAMVSPARWLSIPADVVHAVFAAVWAGGLVGLVSVLRRRRHRAQEAGELDLAVPPPAVSAATQAPPTRGATRPASGATTTAVLERPTPGPARPGAGPGALLDDTARVVGRFSTMAGISFAGIVVAGTLLAVAEVGSVANLFDTTYGQVLLVKLALVGLLLFVAAYNRLLLLPGLLGAAATDQRPIVAAGWRRLISTVRLEALGMVAVLGVTAVLANGTPANGSGAPPPVPFHQTRAFDGGHVTLRISPNQALVNDWSVQFTDAAGAPADLAQSVSIYLVLPSQNVGPIAEDMRKTGVGRFVLTDSPNPPIVGTWQVVLQVRVSEFSQPDVSFVDVVQ